MNGDRANWLETLKVGDLVGIKEVTEGIGHTYTYSSDEITDRTSGSITVSSGLVFDSKGINETITNTQVSFVYELVPLTDEVKQKGKFYHIKKLINLITTGGIQ
ncbi:hypothetical protein [Peribacillus deserti]|uniref:Uncharacterized protein n=1 Tax=Peribacillus deserti TaxID=673318 RepID=A0A2N5M170_9BACI|nr:hypothetical protein [Peribacillus deserti]PLT28107.1 hypothetical protein CUU66_20080 [Peribacillus deserti]